MDQNPMHLWVHGKPSDRIVEEYDRLRRHLEAILRTECICDDETCPSCIAEHALWLKGDHPILTKIGKTQRGASPHTQNPNHVP